MSKVKVNSQERESAGLKGTELNMLPIFIKGIVHPKNLNSVIIYSLSCCTEPVLIFILVLNTKEDILENVGNQTVAGPHWLW